MAVVLLLGIKPSRIDVMNEGVDVEASTTMSRCRFAMHRNRTTFTHAR